MRTLFISFIIALLYVSCTYSDSKIILNNELDNDINILDTILKDQIENYKTIYSETPIKRNLIDSHELDSINLKFELLQSKNISDEKFDSALSDLIISLNNSFKLDLLKEVRSKHISDDVVINRKLIVKRLKIDYLTGLYNTHRFKVDYYDIKINDLKNNPQDHTITDNYTFPK